MINFIKKIFGAAQSTAEAVVKPEVARTETAAQLAAQPAAQPAVKSKKKSASRKKS
jgi:hypothetical protein